MRARFVSAKAVTLVLLSAYSAFGFMHHHHVSRLSPPLRPEKGRSCYERRVPQLALSGEALAVGAVVAGVATIAATRGLSTLAGAFQLADYQTPSGHDLRLDERLKSKRRQLLSPSEGAPPTRSGSSSEGGVSGSGLGVEVDMDWREEVRLASQLPEDYDAVGVSGTTVTTRVENTGREIARHCE